MIVEKDLRILRRAAHALGNVTPLFTCRNDAQTHFCTWGDSVLNTVSFTSAVSWSQPQCQWPIHSHRGQHAQRQQQPTRRSSGLRWQPRQRCARQDDDSDVLICRLLWRLLSSICCRRKCVSLVSAGVRALCVQQQRRRLLRKRAINFFDVRLLGG